MPKATRAATPPQGEPPLQHGAIAGRETLGAHPRRIADHQIESAGRQDVRGLDLEREERYGTIFERCSCALQGAQVVAQGAPASPLRWGEPRALSEQVASSRDGI